MSQASSLRRGAQGPRLQKDSGGGGGGFLAFTAQMGLRPIYSCLVKGVTLLLLPVWVRDLTQPQGPRAPSPPAPRTAAF